MIKGLGGNIANVLACGGELQVKKVLANGGTELVWDHMNLPKGYTLRNWISSKYVGKDVTPPVLELSHIIPTSMSRLEMDVTFSSLYTVGQWGLFSDYITQTSTGTDGVYVNNQTDSAFLISGRGSDGNTSNIQLYTNTNYNITVDNSYIYCNGVKLNQSSTGLHNRYGKGIVLFSNYPYGYTKMTEDGNLQYFNYFTRYKRIKHYIKLSDDEELLLNDLVPVTNESGVPGMYDLVNEVFYRKPSTSTGDFSYG